jgi:hypothetical protein
MKHCYVTLLVDEVLELEGSAFVREKENVALTMRQCRSSRV